MDIAVTVQARTGKGPVTWGGTRKECLSAVPGARMPCVVVAFLAEIGCPPNEKLLVHSAMGRMAIRAFFLNRRMLPNIRTPLFRMAGVTELIDIWRFDHGGSERSMGIVTTGALKLSFHDRVMGAPVCSDFNILMTSSAGIHLVFLDAGVKDMD
jgi:hypothetical protein